MSRAASIGSAGRGRPEARSRSIARLRAMAASQVTGLARAASKLPARRQTLT
jgi:hypothetical protein